MERKKKIVMLHPSLCMGGEEKVLINMFNALDYDKVDVTLWLLEKGGVLEKDLNKNVKIRYFDYYKQFPENDLIKLFKYRIKKFQFIKAFKALFYYIFMVCTSDINKKEIYRLRGFGLIDKVHYDLFIEYHCYLQNLLYWGLTGFKAKKRAIWLHGSDYLHPEPDLRPYAYNKYDKIFAVSKLLKKHFSEIYPELAEKTDVFYNIQDIDGILKKSNEKCDIEIEHPAIVTVGRISYEKGMDRIPECAEKLIKCGYDIHWYIIGDGIEREKIEADCKNKNVENNVHFLGQKENPYPYMKNCDIYVQPSRTEGYCTTTLEAKILKKPIVVTEVDGAREQFIHEKTGLIAEGQDVELLYMEIKRLLDNSELRQQLIDNLKKENSYATNDLSKLYDLLGIE